MRQTKNEELMAAGVTIVDPATTYIQPDVTVGADTVIHPNVYLEGAHAIGRGLRDPRGRAHRGLDARRSRHDRNYCVITDSTVAADARLGPFAHLRPGTDVSDGAHVGNFVELKKTTLGAGSKASHLTYLGDATIGDGVNIGAGTITCNYDGDEQAPDRDRGRRVHRQRLASWSRRFTIGEGAYVAAGSSIIEDVPAGALGIARGRQANIDGWVERRKASRAAASPPAEPGANPASHKS